MDADRFCRFSGDGFWFEVFCGSFKRPRGLDSPPPPPKSSPKSHSSEAPSSSVALVLCRYLRKTVRGVRLIPYDTDRRRTGPHRGSKLGFSPPPPFKPCVRAMASADYPAPIWDCTDTSRVSRRSVDSGRAAETSLLRSGGLRSVQLLGTGFFPAIVDGLVIKDRTLKQLTSAKLGRHVTVPRLDVEARHRCAERRIWYLVLLHRQRLFLPRSLGSRRNLCSPDSGSDSEC